MNTENLWSNSEYSKENYISDAFDSNMLLEIESELGYKLPASYVELMKEQNGGLVKRSIFKINEEHYIEITGILGIGRVKDYSLCGHLGSKFMIEEWEYPAIGVAICDCPSAGHEMIFLDYRECGPKCENGEPKVVYIDQEADYEIVVLANTFEEFINGLVEDEEVDW